MKEYKNSKVRMVVASLVGAVLLWFEKNVLLALWVLVNVDNLPGYERALWGVPISFGIILGLFIASCVILFIKKSDPYHIGLVFLTGALAMFILVIFLG